MVGRWEVREATEVLQKGNGSATHRWGHSRLHHHPHHHFPRRRQAAKGDVGGPHLATVTLVGDSVGIVVLTIILQLLIGPNLCLSHCSAKSGNQGRVVVGRTSLIGN